MITDKAVAKYEKLIKNKSRLVDICEFICSYVEKLRLREIATSKRDAPRARAQRFAQRTVDSFEVGPAASKSAKLFYPYTTPAQGASCLPNNQQRRIAFLFFLDI